MRVRGTKLYVIIPKNISIQILESYKPTTVRWEKNVNWNLVSVIALQRKWGRYKLKRLFYI